MSHWYDKDGNPRHHEGKNGGDTTLREARKLELYPSVTTIGSIIHKEGLVYWKQEQSSLQTYEYFAEAWERGSVTLCETDEELKQFTRQMIALAKEKVTEKSDAGTEIHDKLEKFKDDPFSLSHDDQKMCFAIADCIKENTGLSLYTDFIAEERFCDTELGYAGMCDLHTKPEVEPWVLDYKTKDEVDEKTKGYPEQAEQLVAYSYGLRMPEARIGNIFISRNPPGEDEPWAVKFFEHKDIIHPWLEFLHTLQTWQIKKKYGPYYHKIMHEA